MSVSQLYMFLADRGLELDYMIDWLHDPTVWRWAVGRAGALLPVAWGADLNEAGMIAHVLAIPQLHPDKTLVEALRDFGIELGAFA